MIKYKQILENHAANLDIELQTLAKAMTASTNLEKDKIAILTSLGFIGKFNADLGVMIQNDTPKDVLARYVKETPSDLYKEVMVKKSVKSEDKTSVDAITALANQLEALTQSTRDLIKAQS